MKRRLPVTSRGSLSQPVTQTSILFTAAVMAAVASSAPAQRQLEELGKRGLPPRKDNTRATGLGDVDGDGDLDLVLGNGSPFNPAQSRLCRNDGTGTFTDVTASSLPVGGYLTNSLGLGDVDGDGDLDFVLGNFRGQDQTTARSDAPVAS